jgi:hypothetical protein
METGFYFFSASFRRQARTFLVRTAFELFLIYMPTA